MQNTRKITDSIIWIGANDRRIALFENMFPVDRGVSYNSYVIWMRRRQCWIRQTPR